MKSYKSKSSFQGTHGIHADPPLKGAGSKARVVTYQNLHLIESTGFFTTGFVDATRRSGALVGLNIATGYPSRAITGSSISRARFSNPPLNTRRDGGSEPLSGSIRVRMTPKRWNTGPLVPNALYG
ncbi:MAG: hypothetical protein ACTSUE_19340 [Promethearchaeota archaeon]